MIKRLVVICCILLLPTIAAAEGTMNYGDFWVGGQIGGVFTPNTDVTFSSPLFPGQEATGSLRTNPAFSAGAIVGYNFCMPYRPAWERFFGVALDFQWNQFTHPGRDIDGCNFPKIGGNQFALSFLGRLQYPLMGSEKFTRGRIVPFLMFGPSVVWSTADFSNYLAAAARPLPTLVSLLRLAWNFLFARNCPLGRPSVTVMSLGRTTRNSLSMLTWL